MSLQHEIYEVENINPHWKSKSRIIGRACELYCCKHIRCINCNSNDWLECKTNEKSKDQICNKCNKKYQIKCKSSSEKQIRNIIKNNVFKTLGGEYNTTLRSIEQDIDYIIVLYDKKSNYNILNIMHISSKYITEKNIIPRKPLSDKARRKGWQGCNIQFDNFCFINNNFKC